MQVKVFFGDLADGCQIAEARIGEQNIDMAVFFFYGCIETVEVFHISDITLNTDSLVAADFLERYVDLFLAATGDDDMRAFSNKTLAVARPIPLLPPVIMATFPFNLPSLAPVNFCIIFSMLKTHCVCDRTACFSWQTSSFVR